MVASLRRILILLLLLLQTVAPLVHAHVGGQFQFGGGLHLPMLEALNHDFGDSHLAATEHRDDWSQTVELGSAIKLPAIDANPPLALLPNTNLGFLPPSPLQLLVNFSPHKANQNPTPPFLSANISRAPPL